MNLTFNQPLGPTSPADETDMRAVKIALNRLGYYRPHPEFGITAWSDDAIFAAIKKFQTDHQILVTGKIYPHDDTHAALNSVLKTAGNHGHYIWRTVQDDHVRDAHRARPGQIFSWGESPSGGHPGEVLDVGALRKPFLRPSTASEPNQG